MDVGYPANQATGNHFVRGTGDLPAGRPITRQLSDRSAWLVGLGTERGSVWVVASEAGAVSAYEAGEDGLRELPVALPELPAGSPLAVELVQGAPRLLRAQAGESVSVRSHPIRLAGGGLAYADGSGDLVVVGGGGRRTLELDIPPDARIAAGGAWIAVLDGATGRYDHGVLGDSVEAAALVAVQHQTGEVRWRHTLSEKRVIEGVSPLLADMDQDGELEAVVTVSDASTGARYRVVGADGQTVAQSAPIGQGYRWRHQIAVAPIGPQGGVELVGVRTPHIGGFVEFFSMRGDELRLEAEVPGFSSHRLGSDNLDMAVAADFDADGQVELLVPNQGMTNLAAVERRGSGAVSGWQLELGSRLTTNIAVACHAGRGLGIAVGVEGRQLRVWLPE